MNSAPHQERDDALGHRKGIAVRGIAVSIPILFGPDPAMLQDHEGHRAVTGKIFFEARCYPPFAKPGRVGKRCRIAGLNNAVFKNRVLIYLGHQMQQGLTDIVISRPKQNCRHHYKHQQQDFRKQLFQFGSLLHMAYYSSRPSTRPSISFNAACASAASLSGLASWPGLRLDTS